MIDTLTMGFYAIVCAALAALAPSVGSLVGRIVVGAVVGLAAAALWPLVNVNYSG
jgi:hypothetical protein